MADQPLHLFAGPSLGRIKLTQLDAVNIQLHPPVRRGDIQELVSTEPNAIIAIADGVFHQQPAVGHAEIRDAIRGGASVWGLSSMGAIRASELSHLGMRGFGEVFHAYLTDLSLPDDEVALLHYPEAPFVPISEPMIHWRRYLQSLVDAGLLDLVASQCIQANFADRWYGERTVENVVDLLSSIGGICLEPVDVENSLRQHRVKEQDLDQFIRERPWDRKTLTLNIPADLPAVPNIDLEMLGGLPFIDLTFDTLNFLSAVTGIRSGFFGGSVSTLENYAAMLEPERAAKVFTMCLDKPGFMPPHTELTATEKRWSELALSRVKANSSLLSKLFDLPIRVLKWNSPKVSMTNPFIPQTIFLGEGALQSTFGMLEEVWVHEYAHVWLGMLCEIFDLQKCGSKQIYTLPSGTGQKDARGVLFAAHFAGAVISYFLDSSDTMPLIGQRAERLRYVKWYLSKALDISIAKDLTPMGWDVFERLKLHSEANM